MTDVLDEVTDQAITKEHIVKRIEDWVSRIEGLYRLVESWLPEGWHVAGRQEVNMDEELMRKFQIPPRSIPAVNFGTDDGRIVTLRPRGLWIVGANGRLDLHVGSKHYLIMDRANNFAAPDWKIVDFNNRNKVENFDKVTLAVALSR